MMTRKDYVAVADILNAYKDEMDTTLFEDLVQDFANFFWGDNENFKEDKFIAACNQEAGEDEQSPNYSRAIVFGSWNSGGAPLNVARLETRFN